MIKSFIDKIKNMWSSPIVEEEENVVQALLIEEPKKFANINDLFKLKPGEKLSQELINKIKEVTERLPQ